MEENWHGKQENQIPALAHAGHQSDGRTSLSAGRLQQPGRVHEGHSLRHLLECSGLRRSTYYYALAHPRRPTRPELRDAAARGLLGERVVALGGIRPELLPRVRELGFGGAALLGAVCFAFGGLVSPLVGMGDTLLSTGTVFVVCAVGSWLAFRSALHHRNRLAVA